VHCSTVMHEVNVGLMYIRQMFETESSANFSEVALLILSLEDRVSSCTHECNINFMKKN